MSGKKGFFEKKANRTAMFIALFAALILFAIETSIWSIEMTIRQVFKLSEFDSSLYAHAVGVIFALFLLIIFIKKFSEGLEI